MTSTRPLTGLKVLEIGHSIAAPYAGMILGELGADVVKMENPGHGDYARGWGPPFSRGSATIFQAVNRSKRGITTDLKNDAERARLRRLVVEEMDVVMHNLKPGAPERLGLGAAGLLAEKPSLIYCNLGAFGARGPLKSAPGYDPLMQAFGGLMSMLGEDGRPPVRVTASIMDLGTGMWTVIGILAAIIERARTGRGGLIDTSLFETSCGWMGIHLADFLASGQLPKRTGSGVGMIVPYQVFATADAYLMVAAGNDGLFQRLCGAIARPDLAADPRFTTNAERVANRPALIGALAETLAGAPAAHWTAALQAVGVPCGPVQTLDQVASHPQTEALGILQPAPDASMRTIGLPISFDGRRPVWERAAPALGEHNREILGEAPGRAAAT